MTTFPGATAYPVRSFTPRSRKVTILLAVHITGNSALPSALAEAANFNRAGSDTSSAFVTNRDGSIVQCLQPETQQGWTQGSYNKPNLALSTVKAGYAAGIPPNELVFASCENVGYEPGNPVTAAQIVTLSRLAAWCHVASGLPINRSTVVGHRDFNSVDRHDCPTSGDLEALLGKIISGANALLVKEEVVIATIEKFSPARMWSLVAPAPILGYKIDMATMGTTVIKSSAWTKSSSAQTDQRLSVGGHSYLHVVDGYYAGLWVPEDAHAVLQPAVASGFTQAQMDAAIATARAGGIKAAATSAAGTK